MHWHVLFVAEHAWGIVALLSYSYMEVRVLLGRCVGETVITYRFVIDFANMLLDS